MPSWIRTTPKRTLQLTPWLEQQSGATSPKRKAPRRMRERVGAELKCCAPLEPLPLLSASPASVCRK